MQMFKCQNSSSQLNKSCSEILRSLLIILGKDKARSVKYKVLTKRYAFPSAG